jgi:hypothetical protein
VLSVRDIPSFVTRRCGGARIGGRRMVRDSIHDPQELASTLKFAPRSNPARHDTTLAFAQVQLAAWEAR